MGRWPEPPTVHGGVCLVPLTRKLADLDTVAYLSSPRAISSHSAGSWPVDGFTLEKNLALIAFHEAEHIAGDAFAYALLGPRADREWGCVYLRPLVPYLERTHTRLALPEATVRLAAIATFWLVDDASQRPTAAEVVRVVEGWTEAWRPAPVVFRCFPRRVNLGRRSKDPRWSGWMRPTSPCRTCGSYVRRSPDSRAQLSTSPNTHTTAPSTAYVA